VPAPLGAAWRPRRATGSVALSGREVSRTGLPIRLASPPADAAKVRRRPVASGV